MRPQPVQLGDSLERGTQKPGALLKDLIIRKSWNATRFMDDGRKTRQNALRTLWADKRFADFDPKTASNRQFLLTRCVAGLRRRGGEV
jgi:hypothetical protein